MKCPFCKSDKISVKDSRNTNEGKVVRRRRYCSDCNRRFTTFERIEMRELVVIKKTGAKRPFDRMKIINSITTALRKRNVTDEQVIKIVDKIIAEIENAVGSEINSRMIGKFIMQELEIIDPVAYIRFASVYKDFSNAQDFARFINRIKTNL